MNLLVEGIVQALAWKPFLFAVLGSFLGIIFAAIPGLTVSMGIILLLPFTFHMASVTSMSLLVGVFVGGMTGGSISAILINIPGNPAAIVTSLDGHPLARKGRAGVALGVAFFSSFLGGLFSLVCLVTIAPQLADFALKFGAPELASLVLLGLCLICGFAQTSMSKALISGVLGLSFSTVGMDPHRFDTALHVFRGADSAGGFFPAGDDRAFRGARDHIGHARLRRLPAGFLDAPARLAAITGNPGRPLEDARAILPHRDDHRPAAGNG